MKYKYSKIFYSLQFVLVAFFESVLLLLIYEYNNDIVFIRKMILGATGLLTTLYISYFKEFSEKSIRLTENYISFNSFRFKNAKMKNAISFNVKYDDVFGIEARHIPLIGVWAIKINARNLPNKITVSFCFRNYKEMFMNLCKLVKQYNPNAYIDSRLTEFLERK